MQILILSKWGDYLGPNNHTYPDFDSILKMLWTS